MAQPPPTGETRTTDFDDFWRKYLRAHARTPTRIFHYVAAAVGAMMLLLCLMTANLWYLPAGLALSYLLGGISHFCFDRTGDEKNRIWFQGHPILSLVCCYRMAFSALTGHLAEERTRAGE